MFVFYDTETTGLDGRFSQILQIALIFADDDMNLMASKDLRCRRLPWVVPAPGAMLITGVTPDDLKKQDLSHYEMMGEVTDWVKSRHWPLTFVGYNSLGFDEILLSSALHQSLHDPFLTSSTKEGSTTAANGRADILQIVKAAVVYAPGALTLEIKNKKGPSLQLGHVCRQNGIPLSEGDAHDAFNDVKATIGLAKFLQKAVPDIWDTLMSLTTPVKVDEFLKKNDVFAYTIYPYGEPFHYISASVLDTPGAAVVFDLNHDPKPLLDKTPEEIAGLLQVRGDAKFKQPLQIIDKAQQPILMPIDKADAVRPATLSDAMIAERKNLIASNPVFAAKVQKALELIAGLQKPDAYIERQIEAIPGGTVRGKLETWFADFHAAPDWAARGNMVSSFKADFKNELAQDPGLIRFYKFAQRILFSDAHEVLSDDDFGKFAKAIHARITNPDPAAPYMTIPKARKELEDIEKSRSLGEPRWKDISDTQIRSLKLYYTQLEKEFAAYALVDQKPDDLPVDSPVSKIADLKPPTP